MDIKSILIVKLSAIGDVIHALPVAYALKETYPAVKITWVVEPPAYDLLQDNPCIDEVIVFEKKKFKSLGGLRRQLPSFSASLKKNAYDLALDLQGLGKSAAIAWLSGAKLKYGYCNMREFSHLISKPICGANADGHIVERYLDVARAVGCSVNKVCFPIRIALQDASLAKKIMQQAGMRGENPYIVLTIGANWPNKRWSTSNYAKLCDWCYEQGIIPVLSGSGVVDEGLAREIMATTEIPPINLVGKTTLKQLSYVITGATLLIGGDTGVVHLAAALKKNVIALFGPTDAKRNGPYGQIDNVMEISSDCKHCWQRTCRYQKDCLAEITSDMVIERVRKVISV